MSDDEITTKDPGHEDAEGEALSSDELDVAGNAEVTGEAAAAPANLGAAKYVHATFFVVGIVAAFVSGRVLAGVWNALAAWPPAVRAVPQLLLYGEDERPSFTMVLGVLVGIIVVAQMFRNPEVRRWSDDVAAELSKVVWPNRETDTNGTIVVVVASALATVYVGLLDRLWGFVTTLVYGA
jgi:preprotein translocase subunit SecE